MFQKVIHTGEMVDEIDTLNASFFEINYKSKWYFKHVESMLKNSKNKKSKIEYMHTREYYHRHTKSLYKKYKIL